MDGNHVGMGQLSEQTCLAEQSGGPGLEMHLVRWREAQELERHIAAELSVVSPIDHAHGAAAESLDEAITAVAGRDAVQLCTRKGSTFGIDSGAAHQRGEQLATRCAAVDMILRGS